MRISRTFTYLLVNTRSDQPVQCEEFTAHDNEQARLVTQRVLEEVLELANGYSLIDGYSLKVFYDSVVNGEESDSLFIDGNGQIVDFPFEFLV